MPCRGTFENRAGTVVWWLWGAGRAMEHWRQWGRLPRICLAVGGAVFLVVGTSVIWTFWIDLSATNIAFVNDTPRAVTLPDCSTDIATIPAGRPVELPIASDHPAKCTVDDASAVVRCVTLPKRLTSDVVIRISETQRC